MIYTPASGIMQGSSVGSPVGVVTPTAVGVGWLEWGTATVWIANGLTNTSWASVSGGGGSGLTSFNGRTAAAAIPTKGDYTSIMVPNVVVSVAQSATPTINSNNAIKVEIFNLAQAITSITDSGTPVDGQFLCLAFSDNGTARAITYGATWTNTGATAPTTTVPGQILYTYWTWNTVSNTWDFQYATVASGAGGSTYAAALGADFPLTNQNQQYTWLTTASIAPGTYGVHIGATVYNNSGGVNTEIGVAVASGSATLSGQLATSNYPSFNYVTETITCELVVTATATLNLIAQAANTGSIIRKLTAQLGLAASGYLIR